MLQLLSIVFLRPPPSSPPVNSYDSRRYFPLLVTPDGPSANPILPEASVIAWLRNGAQRDTGDAVPPIPKGLRAYFSGSIGHAHVRDLIFNHATGAPASVTAFSPAPPSFVPQSGPLSLLALGLALCRILTNAQLKAKARNTHIQPQVNSFHRRTLLTNRAVLIPAGSVLLP